MKFNKQQIRDLLWEGWVWDENDKDLFKTVSDETVYFDLEKSYVTKKLVVQDLITNKFYTGTVMMSYHHDNPAMEFKEVFPHTETVTIYK